MKAGEQGIVTFDKIGMQAQYIFDMKAAAHKGKTPMNYDAEAKQAFLAAEAFWKVGMANGHIKISQTV